MDSLLIPYRLKVRSKYLDVSVPELFTCLYMLQFINESNGALMKCHLLCSNMQSAWFGQ